MKSIKAIWLSFEFGLKGDYTGLFTWLDNHEATECGSGLAFLKFKTDNVNADDIFDELKLQINQNVKLSKSDRIYVIVRDEPSDKVKGRFISGARRQSPWEGFGKTQGAQQADSE